MSCHFALFSHTYKYTRKSTEFPKGAEPFDSVNIIESNCLKRIWITFLYRLWVVDSIL